MQFFRRKIFSLIISLYRFTLYYSAIHLIGVMNIIFILRQWGRLVLHNSRDCVCWLGKLLHVQVPVIVLSLWRFRHACNNELSSVLPCIRLFLWHFNLVLFVFWNFDMQKSRNYMFDTFLDWPWIFNTMKITRYYGITYCYVVCLCVCALMCNGCMSLTVTA